jgi:hypothetical protein
VTAVSRPDGIVLRAGLRVVDGKIPPLKIGILHLFWKWSWSPDLSKDLWGVNLKNLLIQVNFTELPQSEARFFLVI